MAKNKWLLLWIPMIILAGGLYIMISNEPKTSASESTIELTNTAPAASQDSEAPSDISIEEEQESMIQDDSNPAIQEEVDSRQSIDEILSTKQLSMPALKYHVITPGQDPTTEVIITFRLDESLDVANLYLTDTDGYILQEVSLIQVTVTPESDEVFETFFTYTAYLDQLEVNSTYNYYIVSDQLASPAYTLKTLNANESTTMLFFGDPQGYKPSQYEQLYQHYEMAEVLADQIDITYIAGDLVDSSDAYRNLNEWDYFFDAMGPVLSRSLFVSVLGNHDIYGSKQSYIHTFHYPKNGIDELPETTFFFDLSYARVAVINTEYSKTFDQQSAWLSSIMKECDLPFKIVLMHRSSYPLSYNETYIRDLAQVFEASDIDLVLSGHDHIYHRTTIWDNELRSADDHGSLDPSGITYIVGGSSSGSKYYSADLTRPWVDYVYDDNDPVFILLNIAANKITIHSYAVKDDEPVLMDDVFLEKNELFKQ